jgi:hypothetical protein
VTAGHLVTHRQFSLHGDIDLGQLDHPGRQLIAFLQLADPLVVQLLQDVDLPRGHFLNFQNLLGNRTILAS